MSQLELPLQSFMKCFTRNLITSPMPPVTKYTASTYMRANGAKLAPSFAGNIFTVVYFTTLFRLFYNLRMKRINFQILLETIYIYIYFAEGKARIAKEIIEHVDEENNSITFKVIEGDLTEHYKDFKLTIQCIPKGKGSVVHWILEYEKLHDKIPDSHTLLQFCVEVSKDIDKQLCAY